MRQSSLGLVPCIIKDDCFNISINIIQYREKCEKKLTEECNDGYLIHYEVINIILISISTEHIHFSLL